MVEQLGRYAVGTSAYDDANDVGDAEGLVEDVDKNG